MQLRVESKPEDSETAGSKLRIPKIHFWCRGMYNFGIIKDCNGDLKQNHVH